MGAICKTVGLGVNADIINIFLVCARGDRQKPRMRGIREAKCAHARIL